MRGTTPIFRLFLFKRCFMLGSSNSQLCLSNILSCLDTRVIFNQQMADALDKHNMEEMIDYWDEIAPTYAKLIRTQVIVDTMENFTKNLCEASQKEADYYQSIRKYMAYLSSIQGELSISDYRDMAYMLVKISCK